MGPVYACDARVESSRDAPLRVGPYTADRRPSVGSVIDSRLERQPSTAEESSPVEM